MLFSRQIAKNTLKFKRKKSYSSKILNFQAKSEEFNFKEILTLNNKKEKFVKT